MIAVRRTLPALALGMLLCAPGSARADLAADTVDVFLDAITSPAIAGMGAPLGIPGPHYFTPHLAYLSGESIRHAWLESDVWMTETIADVTSGADLVSSHAYGHLAAVYSGDNGSLICSRRHVWLGTPWTPDTITALPPSWLVLARSLAVDGDDRPVVAVQYLEPGSPSIRHLLLARRDASGWTVGELDTTRFTTGWPALALDGSGHPRIVVSHSRGFGGLGPGTYLGEASGPLGPFTWTLIDSEGNGPAALVLDGDVPRVAYAAGSSASQLHYGYRTGSTWTTTDLSLGTANAGASPSLAITADGVHIVQQRQFIIAPQESQGDGPDLLSCGGGVTSRNVLLFEREDLDGNGVFSSTVLSGSENATSPRAILPQSRNRKGIGTLIAWRSPAVYKGGCTARIVTSVDSIPLVGVPFVPVPVVGLRVAPNPLHPGAALTIGFEAPRAGRFDLDLFDIAGRRVAHSHATIEAGPRSLVWSPSDLRAGTYRLVVRQGPRRIGQSSLVVLR